MIGSWSDVEDKLLARSIFGTDDPATQGIKGRLGVILQERSGFKSPSHSFLIGDIYKPLPLRSGFFVPQSPAGDWPTDYTSRMLAALTVASV